MAEFLHDHEYDGAHECIVDSRADAMACPVRVAQFARQIGLAGKKVAELEVVVSEICTNIIRHGERGRLRYWRTHEPLPGVVVVAEDEGPGFNDLELARMDGVSRGQIVAESRLRRSEGLGIGMGTLERLSDVVSISNRESGGARVAVLKSIGEE